MAPANGWGLHVGLWEWEFATGKDMKKDMSLPKTKCARERCWTICWSTIHGPDNLRRQKQSLEHCPNGGQKTLGLIHKIVGVAGEVMTMSDKKATHIQTHF
jgi:hypothetical protein